MYSIKIFLSYLVIIKDLNNIYSKRYTFRQKLKYFILPSLKVYFHFWHICHYPSDLLIHLSFPFVLLHDSVKTTRRHLQSSHCFFRRNIIFPPLPIHHRKIIRYFQLRSPQMLTFHLSSFYSLSLSLAYRIPFILRYTR